MEIEILKWWKASMSESQLLAVCGLAGAFAALFLIQNGLNAVVDVVLRKRARAEQIRTAPSLADNQRRVR